jgi:hypothetical protein
MVGQSEDVAQHVAQGVRPLRRRPERELAGARVPLGEHPPRLERHPGVAMHVVAPARDDLRRAKRRLDVADLHGECGGEVVPQGRVQHRGARCDGPLRVRHRIERLVLDPHGGRAILSSVAALRDDGDDRFTDVPHRVRGQRRLPTRAQRRMRHDGGDRAKGARPHEVPRGHDRDDAGRAARLRDVGAEAGVWIRTPDERHVSDAGRAEVVEERRLAPEQARIFEALQRLSAEWCGHGHGARRPIDPVPLRSRGTSCSSTG